MKLGDVVKNYRSKHKITMQEFADRAGMSKGYISMIENNFNPSSGKPITPSLEGYRSIARAMSLSVDELLNLVDPDSDIRVNSTYYIDPETAELAQQAFEDPDTRILMSAKRDLSPESMKAVIDMVKLLRRKENPHEEVYPDEEYFDISQESPEE